MFDQVGVEPVVVRIGAYKGAGDTINRRNSTEEFREVQSLLVNQTADFWLDSVARDLQKPKEEILALWEDPISDPVRLAYRKYITVSVKYGKIINSRCPAVVPFHRVFFLAKDPCPGHELRY